MMALSSYINYESKIATSMPLVGMDIWGGNLLSHPVARQVMVPNFFMSEYVAETCLFMLQFA